MTFFNQANELYNKKNYKEAITLYKKSIASNENEASCLYNTAVCYIKLKQYNPAIEFLNKALFLKKDSKYYFNLAYCYAMLKSFKEALYFFNVSWCLDEKDEDCDKAIKLILTEYKNK